MLSVDSVNALHLHLALENGTIGTRTQLPTFTPIQRGIAQILEQLHHDIFYKCKLVVWIGSLERDGYT